MRLKRCFLCGGVCFLCGGTPQACFFAISTILLATFLYFRDQHPLKFRDYRSVVLFWFMLNAEMTISISTGNMVRREQLHFPIVNQLPRADPQMCVGRQEVRQVFFSC